MVGCLGVLFSALALGLLIGSKFVGDQRWWNNIPPFALGVGSRLQLMGAIFDIVAMAMSLFVACQNIRYEIKDSLTGLLVSSFVSGVFKVCTCCIYWWNAGLDLCHLLCAASIFFNMLAFCADAVQQHLHGSYSDAELLEAFQLFDKDGNGEISIAELPSVLRYLGQNPTDKDLDNIMKEVDADGSGSLDYEEYEKLVRQVTISSEVIKLQLRQAFQVLDKEKKGWLPKKELGDWLCSLGEPLSRTDTQTILDEADSNGDGTIDCDEFVEFLCKRM